MTGPLTRYEVPFRAHLERAGYAPRSVRDLVRTMARASCWLDDRGRQAGGMTPPVAADLEAGVPGSGPVLRFLRHAGVVDAGAGSGAGPAAALLAEFGAWLTGERGLSPVTVRGYRKHARVFLAGLPEPLDGALRRLDAGQVTSFMLGYCQGRNTESAKAMVTAIRALLRFVHVSGRTPVLLAGAVPAVAGWRLAPLPRGLAAGQVGRLLDGCDRDTVTGRRDYAILTVLARLGLRGAEAAALQLGDIDWRAGEVLIRGKGARLERLPLPVPAGEALAAWLAGGRARCGSPAVFVTVRAPYRQLSPEAVRAIMGRACDRAGGRYLCSGRSEHSIASQETLPAIDHLVTMRLPRELPMDHACYRHPPGIRERDMYHTARSD
jgi:site-specific recombinase XerC